MDPTTDISRADNVNDPPKELLQQSDEPDITRTLPSETTLYFPIERIDKEKREILARATSEALDSYKTVFSYEGSKEAFSKWRGNIREMHDPKKAVGRAVKWEPNEETKAIDLILRVSKGAEDTWLKVLDGTLSGLSVGAKNGKWGKKTINGEEVPYLERYDLVEVSLVDNPANPDSNIQLIRADGLISDVLDNEETITDIDSPTDTREGKRVSQDTQSTLHSARDASLQSAKHSMSACGCNDCMSATTVFDPDNDGDIDIVPSLDTDGDSGATGDGSGNGGIIILKSLQPSIERMVQATIERAMSPVYTRLSGIASRLAQIDERSSQPEITRRLETVERISQELDEVRGLVSDVKDLATKIANQPMTPSNVVVNSSNTNRQPPQASVSNPVAELERAVEFLTRQGVIKTKEQQIAANMLLEKMATRR